MNASIERTFLGGIRSAGSKDRKTGIQYGGIYYPAHVKNGRLVQARFEANFFINRPSYKRDGVTIEGKHDIVKIVAWNSAKAAPGKGQADLLAKVVSVGKEIFADVEINSYKKRIFVNNQPIINPESGNPIEETAYSFRIKGDVRFGDDSTDTVKKETAAYTGQANFCSRPAMWNVTGHADNALWKDILTQRMASVHNGVTANYGYARVVMPEGAVPATPENLAAVNAQAPVAGSQPTDAAAALTGGDANAAAAATGGFNL